MKTALTIAGSDSGGGAGIQADLKTFAAHGVFGTSAITAVTAQNTLGVVCWQALPADLVDAQIEAVAGDIGADAMKIGMLANAAIVEAVAAAIRALELPQLVVDPVMIAKGGDRLLDAERSRPSNPSCCRTRMSLRPNIPEAEVLAASASAPSTTCGARRDGSCGWARASYSSRVDISTDQRASTSRARQPGTFEFRWPRVQTRHTHGTGCTLRRRLLPISRRAWTTSRPSEAHGLPRRRDPACAGLGAGHGPLNHFWRAVY